MFEFNLKDEETFVALFRQTETVLILPVITILCGIYAPFAYLLQYDLVSEYKTILLIWTTALFIYGIIKFLLWRLNVFVITNIRILKISYRSIFKKEVSEAALSQIISITYAHTGILSTLFSYGVLEILIAGLIEPLRFKNLRQPGNVKEIIQDQMDARIRPVAVTENTRSSNVILKTSPIKKLKPLNAGDIKIYTSNAKRRKIV